MTTQSIDQYLDKRYTVVTATNRLARYFRHRYAERQAEKGRQSWESADVLPWSAWLQRLWEQHNLHHGQAFLLLNPYQQKLIWQAVIQASAYSRNILHVDALVSEAMASYALCKAWHIPVFPSGYYLNDDAHAFKTWLASYAQKLQHKRWLDVETLPDFLLEHGMSRQHGNNTVFSGFDFITAQQQAIIQALHTLGLTVLIDTPPAINQSAGYMDFPDTDTEMTAAASYARQVAAAGQGQRIGIIVPNLAEDREAIIRIFQRVLQPASLLTDHGDDSAVFTISLGKPLQDYALVQAALTVLALARRQVYFSDVSRLLHSPYIAGAEKEAVARAGLEYELRRHGERVWYKDTLLHRLGQAAGKENHAPDFIQRLSAMESAMLACSGRHRLADWVGLFSRLLDSAGWPGERELSSEEYQLVNAWHERVATLTSLDHLLGEIDYAQAILQLTRIINATRFQPETAESGIQVLNITSAAAMQFDHLWITGLHDAAWPPVMGNYPFIPARLRAESAMPFADTARHYDYTKALLKSLVSSARHVVLSFAHREKDSVRSPSPLLKDHARRDQDCLVLAEDVRQSIRRAAELEQIEDMACHVLPSTEISGGAGIFTDQAKCPFRAFAKHRLHADSLPELTVGLDRMQRGSLVHLAMELFWGEIESQQNLQQLTPAEQQMYVQRCVDQAIEQTLDRQPAIVNANFMQVEGQRLAALLNEWLEYEKTRTPFIVKATESRQTAQIGNIRCKMRLDRIDALADGSEIILDYKTGQVNKANWFDERPADPQLPVYAVSHGEPLAAVAYAHVRQGECRFSGVSRSAHLLPGVDALTASDTAANGERPSWPGQLDHWREIIHQLAHEFQQGVAEVKPLHSEVCRYCDLPTLCRIREVMAEE